MSATLREWQQATGFVGRPTLDDYAARYAEFFKISRRGGIVELQMHSQGGPVTVEEPAWYSVHNAWSQLWLEVGNDPENEVLILTGSGEDWLRPSAVSVEAQHDALHQSARPSHFEYKHLYYDGTKLLESFVFGIDIPTIAAINGPSVAHTEFALLCDITLASETATIVDPHFAVGVVPGDGQQLALQELIGLKRAAYYLYTGDSIDAQTALELGLVNEVLPPDRLLPRAWELAEAIAARPRSVRRLTHAVLQRPWKRRLVQDLGFGIAHEMVGFSTSQPR